MFNGVGRVQGATGGRGGWGALPSQPEGMKGGRATRVPVEGSRRRRRQAAAGHTAQSPGRAQVEKCGRWAFLLLAKTGTLSARDTVLIFFPLQLVFWDWDAVLSKSSGGTIRQPVNELMALH